MDKKTRTTVYMDKQLKEEYVATLKDLGYTVSSSLDKLMRYVVQEGKMPEEFSKVKAKAEQQ